MTTRVSLGAIATALMSLSWAATVVRARSFCVGVVVVVVVSLLFSRRSAEVSQTFKSLSVPPETKKF